MIQFDTTFQTLLAFYTWPSMQWMYIMLLCILFLSYIIQKVPTSCIAYTFEYLYEKVFEFYENILWKDASLSVKQYICILFFVILWANLLGLLLDFIAPIFGVNSSGVFSLYAYMSGPSGDIHFTIALALVSMFFLVISQFQWLGQKWFFYTYLPVLGKGYLTYNVPKQKRWWHVCIIAVIKMADIIISMFLAFLDIIGLFAKTISLSFRLFGNIVSGWILISMLMIWLSSVTANMTEFIWGIHFPIILPLVLYLQGLLVAGIQAMVFPLLVAIFIRVSQLETS